MPVVKRLVDAGAAGRERSEGRLYTRLVNGERGGYLGYAMWRCYLKLAYGYTAAHKDVIVMYTAHELRHVCVRSELVGDTGIEPVTSSVPGKDNTQVAAPCSALASGFILQQPPAHPTRTRARGARVAHGRGRAEHDTRHQATTTDGSHTTLGKPLLCRDPVSCPSPPLSGEHSDAILKENGFSPEALAGRRTR
jgi:hypothetical protein